MINDEKSVNKNIMQTFQQSNNSGNDLFFLILFINSIFKSFRQIQNSKVYPSPKKRKRKTSRKRRSKKAKTSILLKI